MPFFGRNPVYIGTLFAFVLLQLAVIYAKNFGMYVYLSPFPSTSAQLDLQVMAWE